MTEFRSILITQGDTILERLGAEKLPGELRVSVAAFKTVHKALGEANDVAQSAGEERDAALAVVTKADAKLDRLLESLAAILPAYDLGARKNPFAQYTQYSPSELEGLAFAKEAVEATRLASAIKKAKPPKEVVELCDEVAAASKAVTAAIRGVAVPQRAYTTALGKRDALLTEWNVSRSRLERRAIGAWADEPEMVRAFFAPPSAMAQPVTKRAKKPAAPDAPKT